MATEIKCPNCGKQIDIENVLSADLDLKYQKDYQEKLNNSLQKVDSDRKKLESDLALFEEKKRKENELFTQRLTQERQKIESEIRIEVGNEQNSKLKHFEEIAFKAEAKIKTLEEKELEGLRLKNELEELKRNTENDKQKYLLENIPKAINDALHKEKEKYDLEKKAWDVQMEQQKRLIEEMERKMNQGSMQLQGESQELVLEDMLKAAFQFDSIEEVGKGTEGADCILVIRNVQGMECGKIIFESKRTKAWSNAWVDKLKADMRKKQADIAILVSQVYPKGMECFGEKDGVWIASFAEVIHLTKALRNAIIQVAETKKSEENKGEKMHMLYNYLTGLEFKQNIEAIVEGFIAMKNSIIKERIQMEKMWKEREKQLEKVLISTSGMYGSIKGIAGSSVENIPLLDLEDTRELDQGEI